MEVDFNNLRRQACIAYDKLCDKLNDSLANGEVALEADDIQEEMDELRQLGGVIAMVYSPDDKDRINVYAELYPEGTRMKEFNPS